jgi:predicted RNA binding protein YcfA (HicA-like mRNA interferase family)
MRDVDGILDFLDEYDLVRSPERTGRDPRQGVLHDEQEVVVEVDWEYLVGPPEVDQALDGFGVQVGSWTEGDLLGAVGAARDREQRDWMAQRATPQVWDECAWYQPMQQFGPAWGIYIRQDCLGTLAAEIGAFAWDSPRTSETARQLVNAAFFALFLHEHFHHKLEGFGIRLALADRATPDHWHRYDAAVYRPSLGTDDNLEEALANADAYRRLGGPPYNKVLPGHIRAALRRWMKWRYRYVDPPGYRMARLYLTQDSFAAGAELLQTQVLEASLTPKSNPDHWQAGPHMLRSIFPITSDIYLIIPAGSAPALPVTGRPYTVSVLKTEKWLLKNGFSKLPGRGKGDHERYERPDGLQVGLDRGALELSRNIERSIAQQLGVSQREFRTAVSEGRRL